MATHVKIMFTMTYISTSYRANCLLNSFRIAVVNIITLRYAAINFVPSLLLYEVMWYCPTHQMFCGCATDYSHDIWTHQPSFRKSDDAKETDFLVHWMAPHGARPRSSSHSALTTTKYRSKLPPLPPTLFPLKKCSKVTSLYFALFFHELDESNRS